MPPFLSLGFRPFFLAAAFWAVAAIGLWLAMLLAGLDLASRLGPLDWHIHEMLFGFTMAAAAGFMLTAIPNWTGRPPVRGWPLSLLLGLWLLGRAAGLVSAFFPAWLGMLAELAFPLALTGVVAREIAMARNWRNLPMVVPLAAMTAGDLLMLLQAEGVAIPPGIGWRLGLAALLILVSAIGGRIVPNFTRNWLSRRGAPNLPSTHRNVDRLALATLLAALSGWVFLPESPGIGLALLAAAGMNLWRLLGWQGKATLSEPLLFVLHAGYAWLVAGIALLGLSLLVPDVPTSGAIHALTAGALGTMILAVMTRATLGHTGRPLVADRGTTAIYGLVFLAAAVRVAAALAHSWTTELLIVSGCLWMGAFIAFGLHFGRLLLATQPRT